ncbi:hypothetical protein GGX14DRAFT_642208 [Mycena pura]|uniref:Uncharacterized protein n=1 Tax=Mycena pura TaxID=153505 RepID=A0AAD6YQ52_9AGAR|nr:hypothetical protein GGX14DRAFT_642208 [Mycena pura]
MPPVRKDCKQQNKRLTVWIVDIFHPSLTDRCQQSEEFALALGLEDKPLIFNEYKASRFILMSAPLRQQAAMKTFVQQALLDFSGLFNDKHENNKQRLKCLEHYAYSYLTKSRKMLPSNTRKPKRPVATAPDHPPTTPKMPRTPDAPSSSTVVPSKTSCPLQSSACAQEALSSNAGSLREKLDVVQPSAAIVEFLAKCKPPMVHCGPAFKLAGVNEKAELVGMARWKEASLRAFLEKQHIAKTPLQVEALVIAEPKIL